MIEIGHWPNRGRVLCGDALHAAKWLIEHSTTASVVVADPPYGEIVQGEVWEDKAEIQEWIQIVQSFEAFEFKCPIYWWGGIGKIPTIKNGERTLRRPFFEFILEVEKKTQYFMRDLITWKKKRGFGKSHDYLFVREECALFTFMGDKPDVFITPYLTTKRGYPGYNKKYPAKSEYFRRTNVWDETELLRDKLHRAHKAPAVCAIPILTNTLPYQLVMDLYSGSGETSIQAIRHGRKFIAIERDLETANRIAERVTNELKNEEHSEKSIQF